MRKFTRQLLLAFAVMLMTAPAWAQGPWSRDRHDRDDYRYSDRYSDGYYGRNSAPLVGRVLADLDRARSYRFIDGHERKHLDQARKDLMRFESNWNRGRFDRDRLDGAIENIAHLVNSDQVHPRERQLLSRDMNALRSLRASRGEYRGRGPSGW